jgi:hypothetical protein
VDEWHDFFLAAAGAAAVLAGLVFVGVSINLDTIMSNPTYGLPGRALEALVLLVAVLMATILLLVPDQGTVLAGAELLAVGVVDWAAVVTIQVLVLRNWRSLEPAFRWHFVPRVVLCQLATLPIVAAGIGVMGWGLGGLYWLVVGVVLSFLVAVADAWVLLVEIHRYGATVLNQRLFNELPRGGLLGNWTQSRPIGLGVSILVVVLVLL